MSDKLTNLAGLVSLANKLNEQHKTLSTQVTTLQQVGAEKNLLIGVNVNGTALAIAERMVDILIAQGSANGNIAVNGVDVAVKGLAALAYKSKISESELSDALTATLNGKAEGAELSALKSLIGDIPEDSTASSVVEYISERVSTILGGAPEAFDTLKEIADWIEKDETGSTTMATNVASNASKISALTTLVGSLPEGAVATNVVDYIAEEIKKLGISGYVTNEALETTLGGYVKSEAGKGLSQENFTSVQKDKLDSFEIATDAEVEAALAEVFATA